MVNSVFEEVLHEGVIKGRTIEGDNGFRLALIRALEMDRHISSGARLFLSLNKANKVMWCMHWRNDQEDCPHCSQPDHSPVPFGDSYIGKVWTQDHARYFRWLFHESGLAGDGCPVDSSLAANFLRFLVHSMPREDIDFIMSTKPWPTWT